MLFLKSSTIDRVEPFEYLRIFKNGAFEAQDMSAQAEILRSRVRRIVIQENAAIVEIYGRKPELLFDGKLGVELNGGENKKGLISQSSSNSLTGFRRSCVLTVYKLVGPSGFEPPTSCTPSKRSTKLSHGPTL